MLVETIAFEIHDFTKHTTQSFLVENTEENYAFIAQQRFTRSIRFGKVFDFQFEREYKAPKFLEFAQAVADSFVANASVMDLDDIDEMVGM
jgi:hypothetical protein